MFTSREGRVLEMLRLNPRCQALPISHSPLSFAAAQSSPAYEFIKGVAGISELFEADSTCALQDCEYRPRLASKSW